MLLRVPVPVGYCTRQIAAARPATARSRGWGVIRPASPVHQRRQHWRSAIGEVEAEAEADSLAEAQPGADPGSALNVAPQCCTAMHDVAMLIKFPASCAGSALTGNEPNV